VIFSPRGLQAPILFQLERKISAYKDVAENYPGGEATKKKTEN